MTELPVQTELAASLSLLNRADAADVSLDPFPHLIIHDALPQALCETLLEQYPQPATLGVDSAGNNRRWSCSAVQIADSAVVTPLWREFIAYHSSPAFYRRVVELFRAPIAERYGERYLRPRVGVRHRDGFDDYDILLDAQICGNTPVSAPSSVRTAHIDRNNKLFAGLYYLRRDDDDTPGGDLELYRFRSRFGNPARQRDRYRGVYVDAAAVETVAEVPYRKNSLILFVNSPTSLHGVSVRQPTRHDRQFVNLLAETQRPLFATPRPRWPTRLKRRLFAEKRPRRPA